MRVQVVKLGNWLPIQDAYASIRPTAFATSGGQVILEIATMVGYDNLKSHELCTSDNL